MKTRDGGNPRKKADVTRKDYVNMKSLPERLLIACLLIFGGPLLSNASYPLDPPENGPLWEDKPAGCGFSIVTDIVCAFNAAHDWEKSRLGISLTDIVLPPQEEWDLLRDSEKALLLINQERIARGVAPLHGVEENVIGVAQNYAELLLEEDIFDHYCPVIGAYCEGMSPWERLNANAEIVACHDFLSVSENLAVFVTSGSSIALPIERSVYLWMYRDAGSSWGHRHAILWYPYTDDSGPLFREGFLGIGRASGGPYQGPFSQIWNFAELIVMNVFDPCQHWVYDCLTPSAVTGDPDRLMDHSNGTVSADLSGTVNPNGCETEAYFEYWNSSVPEPHTILNTPTQVLGSGSGQSPIHVVATVTNLAPDTQYSFRMVADNGMETVRGETIAFNTCLSYVDPLKDTDHCKGFSPCWEPHIQQAVEAGPTGATIRVLYGNYFENSAACTYKNVYVHRDVILHLGLDNSYLGAGAAPAVIRPGSPAEATLTIVSGTVIPWYAVIK
jgi:hypothetical protein